MRLQLPKNADPENPHKYLCFGPRYSYTVAAEQKARTTYDNILRLCDDPDVRDVIKFLRAREVVHYQRFGEAKRTGCSPKHEELCIIHLINIGFIKSIRTFAPASFFWYNPIERQVHILCRDL